MPRSWCCARTARPARRTNRASSCIAARWSRMGYWNDPEKTAERFKPLPGREARAGAAGDRRVLGRHRAHGRGRLPLLRRPPRRDDQDLRLPGEPDRDRGSALRDRPRRRGGRLRRPAPDAGPGDRRGRHGEGRLRARRGRPARRMPGAPARLHAAGGDRHPPRPPAAQPQRQDRPQEPQPSVRRPVRAEGKRNPPNRRAPPDDTRRRRRSKAAAIVRGSHRFTDPELARIAADRGDEAHGVPASNATVTTSSTRSTATSRSSSRTRADAGSPRSIASPSIRCASGWTAIASSSASVPTTSRQRRRPRPAGDLRLPVLPRHSRAAHHLRGRVAAARRPLRAGRERQADRRALVEPGVRRGRPGRFDELRDEFNRPAARSVHASSTAARRLLPERRHRQLDRGRHVDRDHRAARARPSRSASTPRATTKWSTRASPRGISTPIITSTTSRPTTSSEPFRRLPPSTTSRSAIRRCCPPYYCAQDGARRRASSACSAGDGGDELFGGNSRYAKQHVFEAYDHIPGDAPRAVLEPLFGASAPRRRVLPGLQQGGELRRAGAGADAGPAGDVQPAAARLGLGEVLAPDFLATVDRRRAAAPAARRLRSARPRRR